MDNISKLYVEGNSIIHRIDGSVKLLALLVWSMLVFSFMDIRIFLGLIILGFILLLLARISYKIYLPLFLIVFSFTIFNAIFLILINPTYGSELAGSYTKAFSIGYSEVTYENLWYILTMTVKYFSLLPISLIFILTTNPSKFASSLNKIGVSYKISYSVNLALRYLPEIAEDFKNIRIAQEIKGVNFKGSNPIKRLKMYSLILIPLVQLSMTRIDDISNGMELRGFGKNKKRTWYNQEPLKVIDYIIYAVLFLMLMLVIYLMFTTRSFYYPF